MIADPVERLKVEDPDAKIEFLDVHTFMRLQVEADKLPLTSPWMRLERLQAASGEGRASNADCPFEARSATVEKWN